jgi:uncharacterized membrane protein YphA (DoxX/SURF4 family)
VLVIAILMEDSTSIKKTPEEEKEEREMAEKVNATLAEEEEMERQEEEERKKRQDQEKKQEENQDQEKQGKARNETGSATSSTGKIKGQDEACPTVNSTCPEQESCQPCPEVRLCLPCKECPAPVDCPKVDSCQPCAPCPPIDCGPCPEVGPCRPCRPCVPNNTIVQPPSDSGCPEPVQAMTVPVAMAVGAGAALLVTGVATVIGLVIRYVPPIVSGFIFVSTIIIVWYLSSQYPETARDLGRRAWTTLQEATVALGHRIVEAIRHHNDQVGYPIFLLILF